MRQAAINAVRHHGISASGGVEGVPKFTLTRRHPSMLTRYSSPLRSTETIMLRLGLLAAAWQAIEAAISSLDEIRLDAQRGA